MSTSLPMDSHSIRLVETDAEIAACYPVMKELRPHIPAADFVRRIREQQDSGYILACVVDGQTDEPIAAAGFRFGLNLAWGRFLYVDDLVTLVERRSEGHGKALLDWLIRYATERGCGQFHLDSGVQREGAHRFYLREGLDMTSYHFRKTITREE